MRLGAKTVITDVNTNSSSSPFLSVTDASLRKLSAFCHPVDGGQYEVDVMTPVGTCEQ